MIICPYKKAWTSLWNFAQNGYNFLINGSKIEIDDSYKYLGLFFSKWSHFNKAKTHIVDQADKALQFCIQ